MTSASALGYLSHRFQSSTASSMAIINRILEIFYLRSSNLCHSRNLLLWLHLCKTCRWVQLYRRSAEIWLRFPTLVVISHAEYLATSSPSARLSVAMQPVLPVWNGRARK